MTNRISTAPAVCFTFFRVVCPFAKNDACGFVKYSLAFKDRKIAMDMFQIFIHFFQKEDIRFVSGCTVIDGIQHGCECGEISSDQDSLRSAFQVILTSSALIRGYFTPEKVSFCFRALCRKRSKSQRRHPLSGRTSGSWNCSR